MLHQELLHSLGCQPGQPGNHDLQISMNCSPYLRSLLDSRQVAAPPAPELLLKGAVDLVNAGKAHILQCVHGHLDHCSDMSCLAYGAHEQMDMPVSLTTGAYP